MTSGVDAARPSEQSLGSVDIAIVGSGFSGLGMAIQLEKAGRTDFVVLEKAADLGGTWRDNTYPGAACDVPSHLYSFSFAPNPTWTHSFSPQNEIWSYLRRCADDAGVMDRMRFDHEVLSATFDPVERRWVIETNHGTLTARILVAGTGPLSEPSIPPIPGLDTFPGPLFHSARWDHDVDFEGKRIGVVGTGASAIQFVPEIQPVAEKVVVFQRTPPWVVPRRDRALRGFESRLFASVPQAQLVARAAIYWARELYLFGFLNPARSVGPMKFAAKHLAKQVPDPVLRARLKPSYTMGCKRILISNDWYPALCQPNVEVVSAGLREVKNSTVIATDGTQHEVDVLVFGTGFHVTDMPFAERVHNASGTRLSDEWAGGVEAYLGTTVAGFPNFFMMIGPNTGLGHNSMIFMIESQLSYILDALNQMDQEGDDVLTVRRSVVTKYNDDLQRRLVPTVWNSGGCRSWYLDERGRNTTIWPGFTWEFRRRTRHFDRPAYETVPLARTAHDAGITTDTAGGPSQRPDSASLTR